MTISEQKIQTYLNENNQEEIIAKLAFITTVLRDNTVDDDMYNYYEAVLAYMEKIESKE